MLQDRFLQYLQFEKRFSKHTLTAYRKDLEQFCLYVQSVYEISSPQGISHQHIRSWMVELLGNEVTPRSINRKLSCLKSYFRFLLRAGEVQSNPMAKVTAPKTGRKLPAVVTEQSLSLLFENVDFGTGFSGLRNRLLLELLYCTGLRRSELAGLKTADIEFAAGRIKVMGKGGKERFVPVAGHLLELISTYLSARREAFPQAAPEQLLLSDKGRPAGPDTIYYYVKKYLSQVTTLDKRSPHVLRHSFATHLSDRGAELNAVKELLGHASLAATQVYMHNSIEKLKKVYRQAHPKAEDAPDAD